jgi:hypothetical protein
VSDTCPGRDTPEAALRGGRESTMPPGPRTEARGAFYALMAVRSYVVFLQQIGSQAGRPACASSATRLCRADVGNLRLAEESGLRQVAVRGAPLSVSRVWSSFAVLAEKGSIPYRLAESRLPTHIPDMTTIEADLQDDVWAKVTKALNMCLKAQTRW